MEKFYFSKSQLRVLSDHLLRRPLNGISVSSGRSVSEQLSHGVAVLRTLQITRSGE